MADKPKRAPSGAPAETTGGSRLTLRLRSTPDAIARLLRVPPLAFMQASASVHETEVVHFDTPRHLLRKSGLTLSIRRDDDGFVQRLRSPGAGRSGKPLADRSDPVPGLQPRVDVLAAVGGKLAGLKADRLGPVFGMQLIRRTMVLPGTNGPESGDVVVVIEEAVIEAGKERVPLAALQLEAAVGSAGGLYQLALALHRLEPLRIESSSHEELGYALAGGRPPAWLKAGAVTLDGNTTLDQGTAAILGQCFDHWMVNQAAAGDGRDIEGVHQMRVGLRRLRAALVFLGPWLPPEQASWFEKEVKWLAKRLGAVRDIDVLLADTLAPVRRARGKDRDLKLLDSIVCQAQADAHEELLTAMESSRYTTMLLTMGQWIAGHAWLSHGEHSWSAPLATAARGPLDRVYQTLLDSGRGFDELEPEARHDLRLDVKRLRYAENGGDKVGHGSGGMNSLRAA